MVVTKKKIVDISNAVGKRKTSVASVHMREGSKKIFVNGKELDKYFTSSVDVEMILEPLKVANVDSYDFFTFVRAEEFQVKLAPLGMVLQELFLLTTKI